MGLRSGYRTRRERSSQREAAQYRATPLRRFLLRGAVLVALSAVLSAVLLPLFGTLYTWGTAAAFGAWMQAVGLFVVRLRGRRAARLEAGL